MKHSIKITTILLIFFLIAQFLGIAIIYNYIDFDKTTETQTVFKDLPLGERPPVEETTSFIPIIIIILIGTVLLLFLIKHNLNWVWKIWFLIAVVMALTVAGSAFTEFKIAFVLALIFGVWKVFKPNFWVHNLTELFIYGGIAAIFAPMFNLWSVSILLILISAYDAYAVWKSKHMITLAQSQTKSNVFAGLFIPYKLKKKSTKKITSPLKKQNLGKKVNLKSVPQKVQTALLGGGDIAFPLIFAGVVLKEWGLWQSLIIPFFAFLGLALLFWKSKPKKFYPAMPFISAGCFLGLLIIWLLMMIF